jgi:hypothetical protein
LSNLLLERELPQPQLLNRQVLLHQRLLPSRKLHRKSRQQFNYAATPERFARHCR